MTKPISEQGLKPPYRVRVDNWGIVLVRRGRGSQALDR